MGLCSFLSALFADGRVRVTNVDGSLDEPSDQADGLLVEFEGEYRLDLPGDPPPLSLPAARYGAGMLYRACRFLVYRDIEPEVIRHELGRAVDQSLDPSVHYSVDLTLRFLPDTIRLARAAATEDPLVEQLVHLANQWPLSAVGIEGAVAGCVDSLVADPCLLQLYVDRIIARQDVKRLVDERVKAAATQAIGAFAELAPEIAAALGAPGISPETRDTS